MVVRVMVIVMGTSIGMVKVMVIVMEWYWCR